MNHFNYCYKLNFLLISIFDHLKLQFNWYTPSILVDCEQQVQIRFFVFPSIKRLQIFFENQFMIFLHKFWNYLTNVITWITVKSKLLIKFTLSFDYLTQIIPSDSNLDCERLIIVFSISHDVLDLMRLFDIPDECVGKQNI